MILYLVIVEVELRGGLEYQAALELEMWKEETEQKFLAQLKEKEKKHMTTLADEWKQRDKEREVIFQKKVCMYVLCVGVYKMYMYTVLFTLLLLWPHPYCSKLCTISHLELSSPQISNH